MNNKFWTELIRSLFLIRLGQELGTNSHLSQIIANSIDLFVNQFSKVF
jgi:small basic protein